MDTETTNRPDLQRMLDLHALHAPEPWKRWVNWAVVTVILIVIAMFVATREDGAAQKYVTQEVTRGSLTMTITATGNLEPRNQVDIGSELSGTIRSVMVDVNDRVETGQLLAVLDTTRLNAQVLQAQGSLASAAARVVQSTAGLKEARANYARLLKVRELSGHKLPSQQHLDVAEAGVARAEGEETAAHAAVAQARASLEAIRTDLGKAEIRSPISGLVLVRSVEPGQTVAAALQAPVLFTLAEDLTKMELHVSVDEADVGSVEAGQHATFTVDAFPDRAFEARISQVNFASNSPQKSATNGASGEHGSAASTGVVTYETVLEVDNSELLLRPGMTATTEVVTSRLSDVTLVPNAALRFTPVKAQFPGMDNDSERGTGMMALMPYLAERWKCPRQHGEALGCAWVLEQGNPVLAIFKPGPTDRTMTQVLQFERLPAWSSLSRLRKDPVFHEAMHRPLTPGVKVIVASE
jgi:HlyD family secretion protein